MLGCTNYNYCQGYILMGGGVTINLAGCQEADEASLTHRIVCYSLNIKMHGNHSNMLGARKNTKIEKISSGY